MDLNTIFNFLADFNVFMFLLSIIIAWRAMPFKDKRLRYLLIYFVFTFATNVLTYLTKGTGNTAYIMYLVSPVYLVLFTLFLLPAKEHKQSRILCLGLMALGILLNVYEAFLVPGGVTHYNSISNAFISVFLGALSITGLLKLRYDPNVLNLAKEPMFWLLVAVAIKNIGNLITTAFYRVIQDSNPELLLGMVFTSLIVNYIGIILYWVGFTKAKSTGSGTSTKFAT